MANCGRCSLNVHWEGPFNQGNFEGIVRNEGEYPLTIKLRLFILNNIRSYKYHAIIYLFRLLSEAKIILIHFILGLSCCAWLCVPFHIFSWYQARQDRVSERAYNSKLKQKWKNNNYIARRLFAACFVVGFFLFYSVFFISGGCLWGMGNSSNPKNTKPIRKLYGIQIMREHKNGKYENSNETLRLNDLLRLPLSLSLSCFMPFPVSALIVFVFLFPIECLDLYAV